MKTGDLVNVYDPRDNESLGFGIFLEIIRKTSGQPYYKFLWRGRIAEFDRPYWEFEVINEDRRFGKTDKINLR